MSKINEEDIDLTRSLIHPSEVDLNCVDSDISGTGGSCFYEVKAVDTINRANKLIFLKCLQKYGMSRR